MINIYVSYELAAWHILLMTNSEKQTDATIHHELKYTIWTTMASSNSTTVIIHVQHVKTG